MATKRKLDSAFDSQRQPLPEDELPQDPSDDFTFKALGGGNEVGRSCHIIQYKGKTIMLDAGTHPGRSGMSSLPFFDDFDLDEIDIILITHFHGDHASALPYVLAKTNFKGRVFMTTPTKNIYRWLIQDNVRLGNATNPSEQLYTEREHLDSLRRIETLDFYRTLSVAGIRVTPLPAGHVLGAAMYVIEIGGCTILFTGDYSREEDRHLMAAETPKNVRKVDVLITESTFGDSSSEPRAKRESMLMRSITKILDRGGRVLMPVWAMGQQELLLILDEYWSNHPKYQKVPIYYTSNTARRCMTTYQTHISAMNENIRRTYQQSVRDSTTSDSAARTLKPFDFRYVRDLKGLDKFNDIGPSVVLSSPGMLQNGPSRELLERWAPDAKNGVVMTGYSVEGTMARYILGSVADIPSVAKSASSAGSRIPMRMSVDEVTFQAHVDGQQNIEFIRAVDAANVILVHGERRLMSRLKAALLEKEKALPEADRTKVFSPANCVDVTVNIRTDKYVTCVGSLASRTRPQYDRLLRDSAEDDSSGKEAGFDIDGAVMVKDGDSYMLMDPEDVPTYTGMPRFHLNMKYRITLRSASPSTVRGALESTFEMVEDLDPADGSNKADPEQEAALIRTITKEEPVAVMPKDEKAVKSPGEKDADDDSETWDFKWRVMDAIDVYYRGRAEMMLRWAANGMNDSLADAVLLLLDNVDGHSAPMADDHTSTQPKLPTKTNGLPTPSPSPTSDRLTPFLDILTSQFGAENMEYIPAEDDPKRTAALKVHCDDHHAVVPLTGEGAIEGSGKQWVDRVKSVVARAVEVVGLPS